MEVGHLDEPELEFFGGMHHVDIRFGLMDYGPFDARPGAERKRIRIGIVGDSETVEGTAKWFEQCRSGIDAKASRQPNLFPAFPGLGQEGPLRCDFALPSELQATIPPREIMRLVAVDGDATAAIVEALLTRIRVLAEGNSPPDVILCALPLSVIAKTVNAVAQDGRGDQENLRGQLKAACMEFRIPIQLLWPTTYNPSISIPRKFKLTAERAVQDDATRAWNFFTALYYKANGLPWRLVRDPTQLRTSYVGISFYRSRDREKLFTSTAQMFDER